MPCERLVAGVVAAPERNAGYQALTGHLTPELLKQELVTFRELKGYLPEVVAVHMNPAFETTRWLEK